MRIESLPCLPLIAERHINAVRSHGAEYKYPEMSMCMFPQVWGSTALGFGGIGGQAITAAYTTVVEDTDEGYCSVFFGNRLAYLIQNPSDKFYEDLKNHNMRPVRTAGIYMRNLENGESKTQTTPVNA